MVYSEDANKKPEDASYTVDILTRCMVRKDEVGKRTIRIVPLKDPGEPAVISVPISQAKFLNYLYLQSSLINIWSDGFVMLDEICINL